jgi:hypothetical protein
MDEFTISIPREGPFAAVVGLVLGGIAARHDVTLDVLDDLQLALDELLERSDDDDPGQITIDVHVEGGTIAASIGPVTDSTAAELDHAAGESLDLRRLLEAVVDSVTLSHRDEGSWVELRKGYELAGTETA